MAWPNDAPKDLLEKLEQLARYRSKPAASDIWGAVKEWLEKHGVKAPAIDDEC